MDWQIIFQNLAIVMMAKNKGVLQTNLNNIEWISRDEAYKPILQFNNLRQPAQTQTWIW